MHICVVISAEGPAAAPAADAAAGSAAAAAPLFRQDFAPILFSTSACARDIISECWRVLGLVFQHWCVAKEHNAILQRRRVGVRRQIALTSAAAFDGGGRDADADDGRPFASVLEDAGAARKFAVVTNAGEMDRVCREAFGLPDEPPPGGDGYNGVFEEDDCLCAEFSDARIGGAAGAIVTIRLYIV
jgi:hypothetical protein